MNLYCKLSALDTYNTALLALTFKNMKEPEKVAELNALLATRQAADGSFEGGRDTITRARSPEA